MLGNRSDTETEPLVINEGLMVLWACVESNVLLQRSVEEAHWFPLPAATGADQFRESDEANMRESMLMPLLVSLSA